MRKRSSRKKISVDKYSHEDKKRLNNPPVGLVSSATDRLNDKNKYQHDPYIDPYLNWAGKEERTEFNIQSVSLHIHERIDPQRLVKAFLKKDTGPKQISLFEQPENEPPLHKAIDFYKHEQDWTNRLIAGDSLLVMNSLLNKEGMAGKVQMVYIDPPYGIKYNSNFQPFVHKRDVKDGNDADIPAEPEMIQAFRDTWDLGIHSYLTHLRDRLLLAKELLSESGTCYLQIGDENIHHIREIMDEVLGKHNFVCLIAFKKGLGYSEFFIPSVYDYLLVYAKNKSRLKYRKPYLIDGSENYTNFSWIELKDGTRRKLNSRDFENGHLKTEGRLFQTSTLMSKGAAKEPQEYEFEGRTFLPSAGAHWKAKCPEGLDRLKERRRLIDVGKTLAFVRYKDDFPYRIPTNVWDDTIQSTFAADNIYVVQTNKKVVQRCLLMSTDPGDLVLDPTCGSGTTAFVAEQWGRRWITCDTSRVAIALARQRLMTAKFHYYELAHADEGIGSGFVYKKIPHITLKSISSNATPTEETLYDQPIVDKTRIRVTGPFTVEAVPSLRVKPFDRKEQKIEGTGRELSQTGETGNQASWRDELKLAGIRTIGGKMINFSRVEPMIATRFLHAEGEVLEESGYNKKAYISFGPDYGPLEQRQVEEAVKEARSLQEKPGFVIFAAFHFDPEAAKDIDEINWPGVTILKAQMSVDLLTIDLRKKRSSNQSYWLIGQPDVEVKKQNDGKYTVIVHGFDYYNPISGEIESKDNKHIAMWLLDTGYDERSLFPEQVFFPMKDSKRDWSKLAKALKSEVDEELLEAFTGTESLPFEAGEEKKIAVKIVDNRGIESFVIKKLE